jgi:DNA processing protein
MTERIAGPLAGQGLTLVSGLAYGVDGEVHRAAVEAGGRTLAVVGQGLGTPLSPQANADLARRIVEEDHGALLSIFPMDAEPRAGLYPARNEIIAGLALGVLVVEASASSGALITARHALAAERHVMACPGDATRRAAEGSNRLIADGAPLVQNAEDVLALLDSDLRREMETLGGEASSEFHVPGPHPATRTRNLELGAWNLKLRIRPIP